MSAKAYLQKIEILDMFIESKRAERDSVWREAIGVSSALGGDTHASSGVSDRVGRFALRLSTLDEEITEMLKDREERINAIKSLEKPIEVKVLYKRYVEYTLFTSLQMIADDMGYSHEHIREVHSQALRKIQSKIG